MPPPDSPWGGSPADAEAAGDPTHDQEPDPVAPFGYRQDGKPKTSNRGRPRKGTSAPGGSGRRTGPTSVPGPPRARPAGSRSKSKGKDYKAGVQGLIQLACVPLLFSYPDDAAALVVYGEPLAQAVDDLANEDARFAAVLDRILAAGPYGALIAAAMGLGGQLAVNHGAIPVEVGKYLGAMPVEVLRGMVAFGHDRPAPPPTAPDPTGEAPSEGARSAA